MKTARRPTRPSTEPVRYLTDKKGRRLGVILAIKRYEKMIDELDELEAIRAYDQAKASGEEAIPLRQALAEIELKRR